MVRVSRREEQDHTAQIMAAVHNSRQGLKRHQLINPEKLNAYRRKPRSKGHKMSIEQFAAGWGK